MQRPINILNIVLGVVGLLEHAGVLWWGAVWPWRNVSGYPGDGGMNDYLILATCLLVGVSLAGAAAYRRVTRKRALLLALMAALPAGVSVLLVLINGAFLDPFVYYLALLPGVAATLSPYLIAARVAPRRRPPQ